MDQEDLCVKALTCAAELTADEQRVRGAIEGKLMWGHRRNGICDIMCGEGRK